MNIGDKITFFSAQSAFIASVSTLARCGDNLLASTSLEPTKRKWLEFLRNDWGISTDFLDSKNGDTYFDSITLETRIIVVEENENFEFNKETFQRIAESAHKYRIPFIVCIKEGRLEKCSEVKEIADVLIVERNDGKADVSSGKTFDWRIGNVPLLKSEDPTFNGRRWVFECPNEDASKAFLGRLDAIGNLFGTICS